MPDRTVTSSFDEDGHDLMINESSSPAANFLIKVSCRASTGANLSRTSVKENSWPLSESVLLELGLEGPSELSRSAARFSMISRKELMTFRKTMARHPARSFANICWEKLRRNCFSVVVFPELNDAA